MMISPISAHPREQMAEILAALRNYATRVLVHSDILSADEEQDKSLRMTQFLRTGADYECTEKEMLGLVLRGIIK